MDVGVGQSGSEHKVSPMGVVVLGLKPNPTGKTLCGALEPNSLLMGQTKVSVDRVKCLLPGSDARFDPELNPPLSGW